MNMGKKRKSHTITPILDGFDSPPKIPPEYYSGDEPNSCIGDFVEHHGTPYDPENDHYDVPAFDQPLTIRNRRDAINHLHIYWSKKPYMAVRQYIAHFTSPGDVVFDPMCGSGGTALAALMEGCKAVAIDISPAATFITKNYCEPVDIAELEKALRQIEQDTRRELEWLYETRCERCGGSATTAYTVYSQIYQCTRCMTKTPLYECVQVEVSTASGKMKKIHACPACHQGGVVEGIDIERQRFGCVPVLVSYVCHGRCTPKRGKRTRIDNRKAARDFFEQYDVGKVNEIEKKEIPYDYPTDRMMHAPEHVERWGLLWRPYLRGIETASDFFTKRNLWGLSLLLHHIRALDEGSDRLLFALSGMVYNASRMYRERAGGGGPAEGVYYVPPIFREVAVPTLFSQKTEVQKRAARLWMPETATVDAAISTQSATDLSQIPSNSIDYIFTDPWR